MKKGFIKCVLILVLAVFATAGNLKAQMYWSNACSFAGTNSSYISRGNSSSLNITGSFTIEAWVNPVNSTSPIGQILVQKREGSNAVGYTLYLNNGKPAIRTNLSTRLTGKTVLQSNTWTHVSGKYSSSTGLFSISINGVLDTSVTLMGASPASGTDSLYIGKGYNGPFEGQLDEIRIWNKALSYENIFKFRRTSLGTSSGLYEGLVLSLTFQGNDGIGDAFSLVDWSDNTNNCINRGVTSVDLSNRPLQTININANIELDGFNDYLAGPDHNVISPQNVFTIEAWIYPRSLSPNTSLIHKGSPNGANTDYSLRLHNGILQAIVNNNVVLTSNDNIPLNRWSHVAFVYDGSLEHNLFFINGKITDVSTNNNANVTNGSDSIYIGGTPNLIHFDGLIDELRIKLTAKSENEINQYLFQSIDESNDLLGNEVVYNFDGYLISSVGALSRIYFRNNSGFSHHGTGGDKPISPLVRQDDINFGEGYSLKTSERRIPASGTSGLMIEDTIDIFLNETINDINVFVGINHTAENNLSITLYAPNGDNVDLYNSNFLYLYADNLVTIFNDQADSSMINGRYVSFAPTVKPFENINSVFSGDNSSGKWRLVINDHSANDTGRLYGWGIQFNNKSSNTNLLSAKCLIQGFYNSVTNLMIADTIKFFIRDIDSPYGIIDSSKGIVQSNGSALVSFNNVQKGIFYYVQLKHRNSIETWSSIPFVFNPLTSQAEYNFYNSLVKAFGNNMILIDNSPVRFAIFNGDVNQDGTSDATDLSLIDNAAFNFVTGYINTDVTGDNVVDASDAALTDNNAANFVSKITP